jgi:hypothetical protein
MRIKKPFAVFSGKRLSCRSGELSPHPALSPIGRGVMIYTFSTISHTPQGQIPAQKPHPMHFDSSTTYS